tara:strand:+ start:805 stop:957 length:153 start_codon:yes stop_codon:yes gene_type:complete
MPNLIKRSSIIANKFMLKQFNNISSNHQVANSADKKTSALTGFNLTMFTD